MVIGSAVAVISLFAFWLIAPRFPHIPVINWIVVFPGTVIGLYVFGIHTASTVPVLFGLIINAAVYTPIAFFLIWRKNIIA